VVMEIKTAKGSGTQTIRNRDEKKSRAERELSRKRNPSRNNIRFFRTEHHNREGKKKKKPGAEKSLMSRKNTGINAAKKERRKTGVASEKGEGGAEDMDVGGEKNQGNPTVGRILGSVLKFQGGST